MVLESALKSYFRKPCCIAKYICSEEKIVKTHVTTWCKKSKTSVGPQKLSIRLFSKDHTSQLLWWFQAFVWSTVGGPVWRGLLRVALLEEVHPWWQALSFPTYHPQITLYVTCWRSEGWAIRFQLPAPATLSVTCCPGRTLTSWNHKPHRNCLFYKGCLGQGILLQQYKSNYCNLQATLLSSSLFLLRSSPCVFAAVNGILWFGLNCKT